MKAWQSLLVALSLFGFGCGDLEVPLGPLVRPQSRPKVEGLIPSNIPRGAPATVIVSGTGFLPDFTAFIGTASRNTAEFAASQIGKTRFVSSKELQLEVPATLPAGQLDVTIINPDDGLSRLSRGLTVAKAVKPSALADRSESAPEEVP